MFQPPVTLFGLGHKVNQNGTFVNVSETKNEKDNHFMSKEDPFNNLEEHRLKKPFVCHICNMRFCKSGPLNRHIVKIHGGKKTFVCEKCNTNFLQNYDLQQHVQTVHEGIKPYQCELCNHSCSQKGKFRDM